MSLTARQALLRKIDTHATREAAEDYARREGRIVLTTDGDIYEIARE